MSAIRNLSAALEHEAKQRESQARVLLSEAETLRESLSALNHQLKVDPDIQIPEGTRKEQLMWIINQLGGKARRSEINAMAEKAGIPKGTVASMLGSKQYRKTFKVDNGQWFIPSGTHQSVPAAQPSAELVQQQ